MKSQPDHRKRKLVKPRIQLRMIANFVAVAATGMLLQALLFGAQLSNVAATSSPAAAGVLQDRLPAANIESLVISFLILLPLASAVGVLATFRLAGPIYRFERYLEQVARNEDEGPCRIRSGDELQELCDRINEAVTSLRSTHGEDSATASANVDRAA